jgi:hypothetical protein
VERRPKGKLGVETSAGNVGDSLLFRNRIISAPAQAGENRAALLPQLHHFVCLVVDSD